MVYCCEKFEWMHLNGFFVNEGPGIWLAYGGTEFDSELLVLPHCPWDGSRLLFD